MSSFYDELAPLYHLIYADWDASIIRQGEQLAKLIETEWPDSKRILDVSCGIGTQAIAIANQRYSVTASDLSEAAVDRAKAEALQRGARVSFSVCDMRHVFDHHGAGFDVVISADNSIPHLCTNNDILQALEQIHACLKPGGGVLLTVRDYEREERGRNILKPYGVRRDGSKRYVLYQIWNFEGDCYDMSFFFVEEDNVSGQVHTHVLRTRYYAISTSVLCDLLDSVGFRNIRRIDDAFFQPVLVGTKVA